MNNTIEKKTVDDVKKKCEELFKINPKINLDITMKRKRMSNVKATITGVYTNFITVDSLVNRYMESFTISYIDILIGNYKIKELD